MSNVSWSFATLGWEPGAEAWTALEAAVVRVAPRMNTQDVANTLYSFLAFFSTRAVPLPACYASLWWGGAG